MSQFQQLKNARYKGLTNDRYARPLINASLVFVLIFAW